MNDDVVMKLVDENDVIMMDTCFAMRDEFPEFVEKIEIELIAHGKKIIVKSCVLAELYRKVGSNDEEVRYKATRAVDIICLKRNIFDIDEEQITAEMIFKAFADAEFISDFTINRIKYRLALLTNDYKLGKDINELNNLESCHGKQIEVYSLDKYGNLEEKNYDMEELTNESDEDVEEKGGSKNDISSIILAVIASFSTGLVVDRYGKKIIDTIVKVVA